MALSCGGSLLKFIVFFFNALVFIGGLVFSGFGIYLILETNKAAGSISKGLPIFILAIGLLIFILGFLGCIGACCENSCMLKLFAILISVLLLGEIIGGILVLVYRHKFVDLTGEALQNEIKSLNKLSLQEQKDLRKAINELQEELKCCGGVGPNDWKIVPTSCCVFNKKKCIPYKTGCAQAMYEFIKDKALVVGIVMLALCLLQIGAIVSAFCLSKKIGTYESV